MEITLLGAKTCGESEFYIFEAKQRFPDSGKAYCVFQRKVYVPKYVIVNKNEYKKKRCFSTKICYFLEFSRRYTAFLEIRRIL